MSTLPDLAVERMLESQRTAIIDRARAAKDAIRLVLSDDRISVMGLTFSQRQSLKDAADSLERVLP